MALLKLICGALTLLTLCFFLLRHLLFSPLRAFPGPPIAKCTNLWRASVVFRGRVEVKYRRLHEKYGTAVRIGPNTISISDPRAIKTIYATKNPWLKSEMYTVNDVLVGKQRLSNIFGTRDDRWHDQQVNPIRPFFTMTKLLDLEPLMDATVCKLVAKLENGYNSGKTCNMDDWMNWFAWDVVMNVTFGRHCGFIDGEHDVKNLIKDSETGLYYFAPVCQIPWLDRLLDKNPIIRIGPKPTLTGVMYAYKAVAEYQSKVTEKGTPSDEEKHFLAKYVQLREKYPGKIDDVQLVHWLIPTVLAGGDTTAATLRAIVYYLAKSPDAYQKLLDELDASNLAVPAQWKDIKDLPYLDAVIRESMRLCPGIPFTLERIVPEGGFHLPDGRFVPQGTKVGLNPGVTNRNVEVFGAAADDFIPERWLRHIGESDESFSNRIHRMQDILDFTFGAGSRVCLGKYLAKLEIYKVIATLYKVFDITLVNPRHEWKYHNAWFVYQWDMPMIVSRRESKQ